MNYLLLYIFDYCLNICIFLRLILCNAFLFLLFPSSLPLFSSCPRLPCCFVCYHSNPYYLPCQLITYTCPSSFLVNMCIYTPVSQLCFVSYSFLYVFCLLTALLVAVCGLSTVVSSLDYLC